jgi:hypothetical protein
MIIIVLNNVYLLTLILGAMGEASASALHCVIYSHFILFYLLPGP